MLWFVQSTEKMIDMVPSQRPCLFTCLFFKTLSIAFICWLSYCHYCIIIFRRDDSLPPSKWSIFNTSLSKHIPLISPHFLWRLYIPCRKQPSDCSICSGEGIPSTASGQWCSSDWGVQSLRSSQGLQQSGTVPVPVRWYKLWMREKVSCLCKSSSVDVNTQVSNQTSIHDWLTMVNSNRSLSLPLSLRWLLVCPCLVSCSRVCRVIFQCVYI